MGMDQYPKVYLYRRIVQAKMFIDEHFDENIDLNKISGEAYFSKFHFIRLFKNIYGKTPHQYLTFVRINKAKLLLDTDDQVSQICFSVGFDSVSSFTGLFKKEVGLTPSEYKRKRRRIKAAATEMPLTLIPGCFAEAGERKKQF